MTLLRDPIFSDSAAMQQRMNTMMNQLSPRFVGSEGSGNGSRTWVPTLDVLETDEHFLIFVDLAGVEEEQVAIELENDVLTISGTRPAPEAGQIRRHERAYGDFVRTLTLPTGVDPDHIEADFRNGVLEVRLPKPAQLKPKRIELAGGRKALNK